MLEELMRYVNNRFDRDGMGYPYGSAEGEFTIQGGTLEVGNLLNGQYFWVEGSVLNDGLHMYPDLNMQDETFTGRIVFLIVPNSVVDLAAEIDSWLESNAVQLSGPYESESFGGYSYKLATGNAQGNENPASAWQVKFGSRLRPYRKLNRDWV